MCVSVKNTKSNEPGASAASARDGRARMAPAVAIVLRKFLRSIVIFIYFFRFVKVESGRRPVKTGLLEHSQQPASPSGSPLGSASGPTPVTAQDSAPPPGIRL